MTTFVRAPDAARRLGVTTATLYSYVSRGRITREVAADGKTSLFDLAELDELRVRTARPAPPPPTIDVRISTSVTQLNEAGLRYRDIPVESLVDESFELVAELLWSGDRPRTAPAWTMQSAPQSAAFNIASAASTNNSMLHLIALATSIPSASDAPTSARRLLTAIPTSFGGTSAGSSYASSLTACWLPQPSSQLVRAVNTALVLLADHELATSTLAVRVAASVRASPIAAIIAGLATLEGALHGSAAAHVYRLLESVARSDGQSVLQDFRSRREPIPGFGHKIYRTCDPRFATLLERVRELPDHHGRMRHLDELLTVSGALVDRPPNIDLALGALNYVGGLPADTPLFAVARIAGFTAHYLEELDERPLRFRGLAR